MEDEDQTRRSSNSRSPHSRFGRETRRESPIPDPESAGIGNLEIPRFPIRPPGTGIRGPETGNRGPAGGTPGISWSAPPPTTCGG